MKKSLLLCAAAALLSLAAFAASPTYKTLSGYGNAATPAEVDFISDPSLQFRLVNVNYASDTNNAVLSISTGTTAFAITATNQAATSVTNQINSTNGLSPSATVLLEHAGAAYIATVSTWNQTTNSGPYGGTNVVLTGNGFNVATSAGDTFYLMTTPATLPIGAATNSLNGDALFVGNPARPVRLQLAPALNTNKINTASGRYE